MDKNQSHATIIKLWPPGPPHHLQDICDGEVNVSFTLAIKIFCSLDDNQMGGKVYTPSKCGGGYQNLKRSKTRI